MYLCYVCMYIFLYVFMLRCMYLYLCLYIYVPGCLCMYIVTKEGLFSIVFVIFRLLKNYRLTLKGNFCTLAVDCSG